MKKTFLLITLFTLPLFAQSISDKLTSAINFYDDHNYGVAYKLFREISIRPDLEEEDLVTAKYYAAECLFNLDQLDGAAIEMEDLLDKFMLSNFREAALYKLGIIYFKKGEYRKSRERLATFINIYKSSYYFGSAYYWIGEDYFAENRLIEAEESFKEALEQKPTNQFIVNTIYSLGQVHETAKDYKNAVSNYDELLAYYQDSSLAPKSQLRIGICYFNLNDYDNAILELTDPLIKKLDEKELINAKFFLANSYVRLKEYKNAAQVYSDLLSNTGDKTIIDRINFSLAWIYFQQNNYEDAYSNFLELSGNSDDSLKIASLFWSGECKRYSGDMKSAEEIFKEFLEKYPSHPLAAKAQLGIGSLSFTQNNTADAEKALINATMSNEKSTRGRAYTLLGEMRLNKKLFEDAKKYFSEANKITQSSSELNARAVLGLSVAEFYLNNYDAAIKNLESVKSSFKDFEPDKTNFYLAESYFSKGQFSAALKNYNSIKSSSEQILRQTTLGKAYAYFNLKDFPNAIYYFNEFAAKYKSDASINDVKLRLADSYFGNKNFDKASAIYRELFSKENFTLNNDLAYYQYGQSLFKSGRADEAIKAFTNLQEKFPRSKYVDESQYVIGWINFQRNDFSAAIENYNTLLLKSPTSSLRPMAYYSIGDSYFNMGQYDSSIVFYSKVLDEFPNTQYIFDAVNGIQYAYVAKEQPESAIRFIDNFITSNPNSNYNNQLFFKKGDLYYSIEKYNEAINIYKAFIANYPSSPLIPNAYFWIGKSAANSRNETEAINNFTIARSRSPKSEIGISSSIELANIYSEKKQYASAVNVLRETSDAVPASNRVPELLYMQGINYVKDAKLQEASSVYEQIITYYDGSIFAAKAKVELGKILLLQNNYEGAQSLLKEVGEKRTDDIGAEAQYHYGVLLYNQNRFEESISALVRVRSVYSAYDEWYSKSLIKLGDCYVKLNDKKQAREMYRAVLTRHTKGDLANEAKRKLNQL